MRVWWREATVQKGPGSIFRGASAVHPPFIQWVFFRFSFAPSSHTHSVLGQGLILGLQRQEPSWKKKHSIVSGCLGLWPARQCEAQALVRLRLPVLTGPRSADVRQLCPGGGWLTAVFLVGRWGGYDAPSGACTSIFTSSGTTTSLKENSFLTCWVFWFFKWKSDTLAHQYHILTFKVSLLYRWKNYWIRGVLSLAMISGFFFIIYMGPIALLLIVSWTRRL